ncbi:MAG TPA: glycosyltransferase family 2 protein, partial [Methylobacterium sp.]
PLTDRDLPLYTVLVALHREAAVVPRLVGALSRLDYPAAKLDIKFLIEAGDAETAAALARIPFPARFEVIVVPPGLPRTKPRALNAALPLARGACLVVYDAEDVPDPRQLRTAAEIFARMPPHTACLQGRLVIDNARDSWLTRCFALEYAALFDVLGPALAAWQLPTPLGGTSTHFRTHVLRAVHGWDAWNVTEDADLGLRLARAGYHVGDLPSSTLEEAPAKLRAWLPQRTRWMKGFLQTSFTHGRRPRETLHQLGPFGAPCALALVPGTVVSALLYPFVMLPAAFALMPNLVAPAEGFWANLPTAAALTVFLSGCTAMLALPALGCIRRGWRELLPALLLMPLYFLFVSLAAWLGLIELIRAPDRWNKTEHGLSRTSRSGVLRPRRTP